MKIRNSILAVVLLSSIFATAANAGTTKCEEEAVVPCQIETYLTAVDFSQKTETVTIFSNFLVKEKGELYNVDFMVSENGEIIVISKEYEEEFYRVDEYNSNFMEQYTVPVALVSAV